MLLSNKGVEFGLDGSDVSNWSRMVEGLIES